MKTEAEYLEEYKKTLRVVSWSTVIPLVFAIIYILFVPGKGDRPAYMSIKGVSPEFFIMISLVGVLGSLAWIVFYWSCPRCKRRQFFNSRRIGASLNIPECDKCGLKLQ